MTLKYNSKTEAKLVVARPLNDLVYTNPDFAKRIIDYFDPQGFCLDPCQGKGAFYNHMPEPKDWCEIDMDKDFFDWDKPVDWIITNPPWSNTFYRKFAQHAFKVANNVVFLIRLHNCIGTKARHYDWKDQGLALKEVILVDWKEAGLRPEGFALAVMHWQKNYQGDCKWSYWV